MSEFDDVKHSPDSLIYLMSLEGALCTSLCLGLPSKDHTNIPIHIMHI